MNEEIEKEIKKQYNFLLDLFTNVLKEKRDISLKELSEKSGVSTAVISDFQNKKYIPKVEILLRLFYALDIKLDDLVKDKELKDKVKKKTLDLEDYRINCFKLIKLNLLELGVPATSVKEIMSYIKFRAHEDFPNIYL